MNLNQVIIAGNLTRDPESKFTPSGTCITNVSVAVNRRWKDQSGQEKEEVYFGDAIAFGKTAELIAQHFKKGMPIFLQGRLKREEWEDKNTGAKRSATRIIVESFQFVGKREDGAPRTERPTPARTPTQAKDNTDDIPF
jgi:single-strand DNA-binding protein